VTGLAVGRSPRSGRGLYIDHGGTWIGPGQDAIYGLMTEFGIPEFEQFTDGDAMMFVDGKKDRYGGTIPWTMSPWVSANVGIAFLRLGAECARPFRPRLL
jgi:monoamine oxidase